MFLRSFSIWIKMFLLSMWCILHFDFDFDLLKYPSIGLSSLGRKGWGKFTLWGVIFLPKKHKNPNFSIKISSRVLHWQLQLGWPGFSSRWIGHFENCFSWKLPSSLSANARLQILFLLSEKSKMLYQASGIQFAAKT